MTGPEQNRNAQPDARARQDDRARRDDRARQDDRARRDDRARWDDRDRDRARGQEQARVRGQEQGRVPGQEQERVRGRQPEGTENGSVGGRPRGPLIGEYAPPYRRRSGRVAAVLLYRNGGHRVVWPDRTEDVNKPLLGSAYTVFEVRLGRHVTEFRLQLPAAGDGVFFEAVAKIQWAVTDPHLVVREQVEDVAELLHDELLDGLRRISRRFRITDAQRADEAVRDELSTGRLGFGRDVGLRTRVLVFIDLDASVKAEVSRRDLYGVTMEADQRVAEAERRRQAAERALVADRARELEALLRRGDHAQIAHHMAMHPDKQWEIRTQLQQERREGQADYLAVFHRLLDTGVLERHDIGEQMYQVLTYLRTQTGGVIDGITDRVLNPSGGPPQRRLALEEGRPEPSSPDWDEEHEDAPRDPWVHEPTRVESGSERERQREGERQREEEPYGRNDADEPHQRYERYEGDDRYGRDDRYHREDPYDRERSDHPRRSAGPSRPSSDFNDWDDE
ncbi:hypothetical protein [Streptomyces exfoliatus]|uniref:hypothetical protein n=1 Tax=Streptomyces exfoliatus TaxID=1905 RepID=UPI003C2C6E85